MEKVLGRFLNTKTKNFFLGAIAVVAIVSFTAFLPGSSVISPEVRVAEGSPKGSLGGKVVPASCASYAHWAGECDPNPTCSNVTPDGAIISTSDTYEEIYVLGVAYATQVQVPVWSLYNGQDDIVWYPATDLGGGTWRVQINPQNHSGTGWIAAFAYMWGTNGSTYIPCDHNNYTIFKSAPPTGSFDSVNNTACTVTGWAYDSDAPDTGISTHVYIGGPAGSGTYLGAATANEYRADLCGTLGGSSPCNHAFTYALPELYRDNVARSVYTYGIDTSGGPNTLLSGSPRTIQCAIDYCANIAGVQTSVPAGYYQSGSNCYETASLVATDPDINAGDTTPLSWSCGTSGTSSGVNFSTGGAPSGSVNVSPSVTTNYTVNCPAGGTDGETVTVYSPALTFSVQPTRIKSGNSATVTWSATGVTSCTVLGPNVSATGLTGSRSTGALTQQSIYTLTCTSPGGSVSSSATVNITPIFQE